MGSERVSKPEIRQIYLWYQNYWWGKLKAERKVEMRQCGSLRHDSTFDHIEQMELRAQMSPGEIASVLKEEWSRFHVKRAWLFGSQATGKTTSGSDWDFLVEFFEPPGFDAFMGLKSGLEEKLKGHVDLLSRTACPSRFLDIIESDLVDVT